MAQALEESLPSSVQSNRRCRLGLLATAYRRKNTAPFLSSARREGELQSVRHRSFERYAPEVARLVQERSLLGVQLGIRFLRSFAKLVVPTATGQMTRVFCKKCGVELDESPSVSSNDRRPCCVCGSRVRHFGKPLTASISFHSGLRGVAYGVSKTKWFAKLMEEASFTRRRGIWSRRLKVENKRSNEYIEIVTNPSTGGSHSQVF